MNYRVYDPEKDKDAAHRIWREVAWNDSDEAQQAMDHFLQDARTLVTDIDGEPECLVCSLPADLRYLDETLPISVVAAVTTGRVARKMGFAGRLTAQLIAQDVAAGAAISALGMFEQGF